MNHLIQFSHIPNYRLMASSPWPLHLKPPSSFEELPSKSRRSYGRFHHFLWKADGSPCTTQVVSKGFTEGGEEQRSSEGICARAFYKNCLWTAFYKSWRANLEGIGSKGGFVPYIGCRVFSRTVSGQLTLHPASSARCKSYTVQSQ